MKNFYLLLAFMLMFIPFNSAEAQHEIRIQGVVRDLATSEPIGGVSVIFNGDQIAFTDVDGKYSAFVPSNAELLFYKPEYNDYEVTVDNRQIININMTVKLVELGESIVVGKMSKKTIVVDQTELEVVGNYFHLKTKFRVPKNIFTTDKRFIVQPSLVNVTREKVDWFRPVVMDGEVYQINRERVLGFEEDEDVLKPYIVENTLDETQHIYSYHDSLFISREHFNEDFRAECYLAVNANYENPKKDFLDTVVIARGTQNPLRFLDYHIDPLELNDTSLIPKPEMKLVADKGVSRIGFVIGKAQIDNSDPNNEMEMNAIKERLLSIAGNRFSTLNGISVTLSGPVTIPETFATIDVIKNLTINLNGHTLTYLGTGDQIFNISNTGSLTINDRDNDRYDDNDTEGDADVDNSAVISNTVVATTDNGSIAINGGKYETPNATDIFTLTGSGSVAVNKGLFLGWDPDQYNFVDRDVYRSVKRTLNNNQYYQVDIIIPYISITQSTSNSPTEDVKQALQNPFVDKLIIDDACAINNTGSRLDINHDMVIEGSSLSTDINTGGATGNNYIYGFAVLGPYNVTFKNLEIIGGGIAGSSGATIHVDNCSITTKYKKNGGNAIYMGKGYILVENTSITILSKDDKNTYNTNNNYFGADLNGKIEVKGNVTCTGSGKEGFATITSTNSENKSGEILIYSGTYDKNPSTWVAEGYESVYDSTSKTYSVQQKARSN